MELKFAFALNENDQFEKKHFGDADKFVIFQQNGNDLIAGTEIVNSFINQDEKQSHGLENKGKAIFDLLKSHHVNVLVSQQFGKNIKMINKGFIPVIISESEPLKISRVLQNHLHWIQDEWRHRNMNYNLFTIKSGILKTAIKE